MSHEIKNEKSKKSKQNTNQNLIIASIMFPFMLLGYYVIN